MSRVRKTASDPARVALNVYRAERSISTAALAKKLGMQRPDLCAALRAPFASFSNFRRILKLQRETGLSLWVDADEVAQLAAIGAQLGADLLTAPILKIRDKVRRAGLTDRPFFHEVPAGFPMFAALLAHHFPASPALAHPRYAAKSTASPT